MKIAVYSLTTILLLVSASAVAQQRDPYPASIYAPVYEKITTDVTCGINECRTLQGWRDQAVSWCNRFQSLNAQNNPAIQKEAASNCQSAKIGLFSALIKANSYGFGTFTDNSEPTWFHEYTARRKP
jgi:hypothetical protein